MNIPELIKALPELLKYLVPGFILVRTTQYIIPQSKEPEPYVLLRSMAWSTVLLAICEPALAALGLEPSEAPGFLVLAAASVILGVVLGYLLQAKWPRALLRYVGIHTNPDASVWNQFMKGSKDHWVRVYVESSKLVYLGWIDHYSLDPEPTGKELVLRDVEVRSLDPNTPVKELLVGNGKVRLLATESDTQAGDDSTLTIEAVYLAAGLISRIEIVK